MGTPKEKVKSKSVQFRTPPPFPTEASANAALVRPRHLQRLASQALTDKLYVAPIVQTANWCNETRYPVYLYVYSHPDSDQEVKCVWQGTTGCFIFILNFQTSISLNFPWNYRSCCKKKLIILFQLIKNKHFFISCKWLFNVQTFLQFVWNLKNLKNLFK